VRSRTLGSAEYDGGRQGLSGEHPLPDEHQARFSQAEPGRIPAEDRLGLPLVQLPPQFAWKPQHRIASASGIEPSEVSDGSVPSAADPGPEVEGKASLVSAATGKPVDDLEAASAAIEVNLAAMRRRRQQPSVTVMRCDPFGGRTSIEATHPFEDRA